jgi:hypothetical protein
MARRIGDAAPPADTISLRDARRELIKAANFGEHAKAMSDYADAMAAETRDPGRINAINNRIDAIEDEAIHSIRAAISTGGIAAYFKGYDGERSIIPRGWLDTEWLSEQLLTDGAVPIDERNNRDRNGTKRLVYFKSEDWKALLSELCGAGPAIAVVPPVASRDDSQKQICGAPQLEKQSNNHLEPPPTGKLAKLWKYFETHFLGPIPRPSEEPRQTLRGKILEWDKALSPLDEGTLKKAIDGYNERLATLG